MLNLLNLTDRVRGLMLEEIEADLAAGTMFVSSRLSNTGQQNYVALLKEAAQSHDDSWLANQLGSHGRMNRTLQRAKPKGGYSTVKMPENAAETLAEGEFNRYYARAVCRMAEEVGVAEVVVYRAKATRSPRAESEAKIGSTVNAMALLDDLRSNPGADTWLGIPSGPNSGISVCLPEPQRTVSGSA